MEEKAMYFAKKDIYERIRKCGGVWNDSKERPIICLIESNKVNGLYWAIPVGNWNHRDEKAKGRIEKYLSYPKRDIRSCFYHVGRTNLKSIFFISDVIPITEKYIERDYIGFDEKIVIIKNKKMIAELEYKLSRVLSFEDNKKNYFRQHITAIKSYLIAELAHDTTEEQVAVTKES
ncbi:hypothetical protein [Clostridium sporogenes]|uniref:hypothetical protein n=1 Tax=Clostridium sporogenes TaxID=1509 RepID=UPI0013D1583D|nr:hypothetical protein [Clostridium sporogenes]NFH40677.1 hypothetical protein [Clostridium sporogenes]